MQKKADITFDNNCFYLSGDLDFYNVMSVYEKSLAQIKQIACFNFDFSQLHSSDSSALALMVEWVKSAKVHRQSIQFSNVSSQLKAIAEASGLKDIICRVD